MKSIFEDKLNTVLIIDDEPFNTEWLTDYFIARGFEVVHAEDLQAALNALEHTRYRYVVIDLSIPVSPVLAQPLASLGTEFFRYPGLMAARRARTTGHNTFQVIVYSVHNSPDVKSYADLIVCHYILKGRPRELKDHVESTLRRIQQVGTPCRNGSGQPPHSLSKYPSSASLYPRRRPYRLQRRNRFIRVSLAWPQERRNSRCDTIFLDVLRFQKTLARRGPS